jgi:phytol kinase
MLRFVLLSLAFLALFGTAEVLYHYAKWKAEHSRKFVHVGTGLLTLLFPVMLRSHWEVLLLCASFAVILIASKKWGFLPSINGIQRTSHGSICYPIAVWLSFWLYEHVSWQSSWPVPAVMYFYIPLLIMALCDPAAALVGRRWPIRKFQVGSGTKSVAGMLTFFVVAIVLTFGLLWFTPSHMPFGQIAIIAVVLGFTTSLTEAFTPYGLDNLTIPIVAQGVLYLLAHI